MLTCFITDWRSRGWLWYPLVEASSTCVFFHGQYAHYLKSESSLVIVVVIVIVIVIVIIIVIEIVIVIVIAIVIETVIVTLFNVSVYNSGYTNLN